ncbi:MAG: hypothetical protein KF787_12385 [Phycisphaeraceae bacterium]|nr:hypothetical protein [Phycisphaerae bacterium]MBX3393433.1 hypothetical protein [Phycisphaeraceae bacterium]
MSEESTFKPPARGRPDATPDTARVPELAPRRPLAWTASDQDPVEVAARARVLVLRAVRISFLVVLLSVALLRVILSGDEALTRLWYLTFGLAVAMAALFIAIDILTPTKKIATMVTVAVGLLVGVVSTIVVSLVIDLVAETYTIDRTFVTMFKILLGICLCYLGVTVVLQTQDDVRLLIPYVEFAKQLRGPRPLIMDSSALIDARVADALQTGFFQAPIIVPRFVIAELHQLADSHDKLKRAKGRRALDIVARLQRHPSLDVSVDPAASRGFGADQALVELASRLRGMIVTTDSGLVRIATIQGATALNINDLAAALRPALTAGDTVTVRLVKPGEQPGQAVGYLPDGTMIVAEDGGPLVGSDTTLMVISTLQTSAGRLVFARTVPLDQHDPPNADHAPFLDGGGEQGAQQGAAQGMDSTSAANTPDNPGPNPNPGHDDPAGSSANDDPRPASPRGLGPFPPRGSVRPKGRPRSPRR